MEQELRASKCSEQAAAQATASRSINERAFLTRELQRKEAAEREAVAQGLAADVAFCEQMASKLENRMIEVQELQCEVERGLVRPAAVSGKSSPDNWSLPC